MRSLAFAITILAGLHTWAQQVAFQTTQGVSEHTEPAAFSETVVSALSASDQHTTFLKLLQRSKCIPLLAHINTSTVFAPTDKAWVEWAEEHRPSDKGDLKHGWLSSSGLDPWISEPLEEGEAFDNQNWALRQHLLYHMLNYTLAPEALVAGNGTNITTETTLLFPLAEEPEQTPLPPPGPPWLPRGGEGLLSGHGQRLRLARGGSEFGGDRGRVGVDWLGEGGVAIWDGRGWKGKRNGTLAAYKHKGDNGTKHPGGDTNPPEVNITGVRWVRNGVVIGVQGVLEPPPSVEDIIRTHPALTYLSHLLPSNTPDPLPSNLTVAPHLTIFAPSNDAFQQAFDDVEKRYLESDYGVEAIGRIMAGGVIVGVGKRERVGWRDTWGERALEVGSSSGEGLCIEAPSNGSLIVNGTEAQSVDIFASNGVVHIMPNLLVPEQFSLLNSAEKVLLSLNATRFVSLLRTANLSATYAGEPGKDGKAEQPWTFLAPSDDMLDMADRWAGPHGSPPLPVHELWQAAEAQAATTSVAVSVEPMKDVTPLQALLQYHIIPGRLMPGDIKDEMLVGTELRTSSLAGGRQRLRIDVADRLDGGSVDNIGLGDIRFGGATALGPPTKFGKSAIYIVSNLLSPPDDALQVAVSDLQTSTFVAAVYAAELDHAFKHNPGITYFVPRNRAFGSLGLVMNYLLLGEGKDELRRLLKYHAVDRVIYTDDAEVGKQVYKTLEGGEIVFRKPKGNGTLSLLSPTRWENHDSGEALPSNGEIRPARITHRDALTSTGTIHTIDSVVLPADLRITIAKLIRGSKQTTMADLMERAGLSWVLEGREPSRDEIHHAQLHGIVRSPDDAAVPKPDLDSLALPSYTLLCPTDKAFSRLNLTHYLHNEDELIDLLKLHIIPTQPSTPKTASSKQPASPPSDGRPLAMEDDLVYSTLLSSKTKYGEVAFRATGDNSFIVGIRNARAGIGHASARIGSSGRASVRWKRDSSTVNAVTKMKSFEDQDGQLWRGGMTLGGGVLMIDSVLVPYEPSWFSRWGWLILTLVGVGIIVLIAVGSLGWWWVTRDKRREYETLEGEDDDS